MKFRLASLFCGLAVTAAAATSTAWELSGFNDFLKGRLSNLSLTSDGSLALGPGIAWNVFTDQPAVWSMAMTPDGDIFAGTGHQGRLIRLSPDGKSSTVFSGQQPEVFAVAADKRGNVFFGTSPKGGVYRINRGSISEIWHSPAKYVWAIVAADDGSLYIGAGEPGRIYHVGVDGASKTSAVDGFFYDTQQLNVTALAMGPNGHLLAGTDPNGILYEITGQSTATILYDSGLPEIKAIALAPSGDIYAAAMGGAVSTRTPGGGTAATQAINIVTAVNPTVVTVTEAENADNEPSAVKGTQDTNKTSGLATATGTSTPAIVEVSGAEKSAIYRIRPSRAVDTIRSSKDENIYDLLVQGDSVWFATDDHARIYKVTGSRTTLVAEPGAGQATQLWLYGGKIFAATSNPGRILSFATEGKQPGAYESPVHDSTSVARWGHFQWHGAGDGISFQTRTGNSARPDDTWSAWSVPTKQPAELIKSPVARFIQWRAEWPAGNTAQLDAVDVPYLPQNGPPAVHSITVSSVIGANAQKATASAASSGAAYSITVTDTGQAPAASTATSASQSVSRIQTSQTQISWQADDPDNDKLAYSVYFRPEEATAWQLIRSRMFENTLLLDPDVFADGRYFFKVVASDAPSNPAEFAQESELVSSPVLIDNTPPLITTTNQKRDSANLDFDVDAKDAISPLRLCEFSVDAGSWQPVESVDGVTDSPQERFHIHVEKLKPGEHLIVVRVYDSSGNAGLARLLVH